MKLQILIPQYKETDEVLKSMLDSIAIQQNIDFKEVGVIIVNDGSDVKLSDKFLKSYPYNIEYYQNEHRGVSATRNACLDKATADYVMFCDADDMFYTVNGLWLIFNEIENGGFDGLISVFIEEGRHPLTKQILYYPRGDINAGGVDSTFVHGKVYKRNYLLLNNIRWNDNLTIHEDSYFNIMCQRLTTPDRLKYCPMPFYLWKWRDESVCRRDEKYILKTYNNMLDSNTALVEEFLKRGKYPDAQQLATTMIYDAYYTMNKSEWINQDNKEYRNATEKRFQKYYHQFKYLFDSIPEQLRNQIIIGMRNRFFQEGMMLETITFNQWIEQIENLK